MNNENPQNSGDNEEKRDGKGRFTKGHKPTSHRQKGSLSFKTRIEQILKENPDRFEDICNYFIDNKKMRELLWKMYDGMPHQSTDVTTGGEPIRSIYDGLSVGGKIVQGHNGDKKGIPVKEKD